MIVYPSSEENVCHSERSRRQAAKSKNPFFFVISEGDGSFDSLTLAQDDTLFAANANHINNHLSSQIYSPMVDIHQKWG